MKLIILNLILLAINLCAEELPTVWFPHDHPAMLQRRVTAFTEPARTMAIAAEFNGRVVKVLGQEGEIIPGKYGSLTPIIALDDRLARIARDNAQVQLTVAENEKKQAEIRLELARLEAEFQHREVRRIQDLATTGKVRQSDLDAIHHTAAIAELKLQEAQSEVLRLDAETSNFQLFVDARAEEMARHNLMAPAGWTIEAVLVEPGEVIPNHRDLMRVVDLTELAIIMQLNESEIAAIQKQIPITVVFIHRPDLVAAATIHHLSEEYDRATNKRQVELRLTNPSGARLTGGMEVEINLNMPDPSGSVIVPTRFVAVKYEQYVVYLEGNKELIVRPLRFAGDAVVVSADTFPHSAQLVLPTP